MSALQIYLFGTVRIVCEDRPVTIQMNPAAQALLVYLLLFRHRTHRRDVLIDLFWGNHDEGRARRCLSTTLWRLRSQLEPAPIPHGPYLATTATGDIGFNTGSDYWLDVAIFEAKVTPVLARPVSAMATADALELEKALQLYTGELLEGYYDDWALRERERLRGLYLKSLGRLLLYYQHLGHYENSLACGQKILDIDPLREEIHREMMRLYLQVGQRALAVQQYETCRRVLAAELKISPMAETQALYAQIVSASGHDPRPAGLLDEQSNLRQALQQLNLATRGFDEAREQLQRAIQIVLHFIDNRDQGSPHRGE